MTAPNLAEVANVAGELDLFRQMVMRNQAPHVRFVGTRAEESQSPRPGPPLFRGKRLEELILALVDYLESCDRCKTDHTVIIVGPRQRLAHFGANRVRRYVGLWYSQGDLTL